MSKLKKLSCDSCLGDSMLMVVDPITGTLAIEVTEYTEYEEILESTTSIYLKKDKIKQLRDFLSEVIDDE